MNYIRQYKRLIETRLNRQLVPGEYYEKHHIIPKCICKSNAVVFLTYREHIIAHHLLYKVFAQFFGEAHECTINLRYALVAMVNFKNRSRKKITDHRIAVLIKSHSKKANRTRKPHSIKTKSKISRRRKGKGLGIVFSASRRQKISKSKQGIPRAKSTKQKLSDSTNYLWYNTASDVYKICSAYELEIAYKLNRSNLCAVKHGKRKACGGWEIVCRVSGDQPETPAEW